MVTASSSWNPVYEIEVNSLVGSSSETYIEFILEVGCKQTGVNPGSIPVVANITCTNLSVNVDVNNPISYSIIKTLGAQEQAPESSLNWHE